jgi:solute carrier family 34 (sodium-dependent phosphate cotransporter)
MDTLLAALLLNNPHAFTVVLVEMVSIALVSLVILLFIFRHYERFLLRLVDIIGGRRRNLALFLGIIVGVPVLLMLVR